ncbi:MAG: hypothetical protein IJX67_10280 [Oscillospiraceae bacterium]|nr:hypothetical protein [Oscillospiraceae bacterium]
MACETVCRLCPRLVLSQTVTFADGTLTINLPAGSYNNGQKYCIVIAQAIPDTTTITAPVVITIGDGTEEYPLTNRCCAQLTAASLRTRTRYPTVVSTSATGGTFKMLGKGSCAPNNNLTAIDGTAPATGGGGA